ncbi:hypothetical protein BH24PSE2_BH24PSE2_09800 [soil metagenome]
MSQAVLAQSAQDFPTSAHDAAQARVAIAALAASCEPRVAFWERRFRSVLDEAVTPHGLGQVIAGVDPADALADGFALSLAPLFSGPDCLDYMSVEALTLRLARLLIADKAVALEVSGARPVVDTVREDAEAPFNLANLPGRLAAALERFRLGFTPAALTIRCDHPDAKRMIRVRRPSASPALHVRIDDAFMAAVRDGRPIPFHHRLGPASASPFGSSRARRERMWVYGRVDARAWWRELVQCAYTDQSLIPVFDGRTGPASPLAGAEAADCVEPRLAQCAPAESARITLEIDLRRFIDGCGRLDRLRLARSLGDALRLADNLLDAVRWPLASLRADAQVNRRVALHVAGLGDTVAALGLDPGHFTTLVCMTDTLGFIRSCVFRHSRRLARRRAPFPALHAQRMIDLLPNSDLQAEVQQRIRQHATRHRELLVLSPFSVLPAAARGIDALPYFNLLPLLRFADSVAFRADGRERQLTLEQYERFLRLAWAASMPESRRPVS